MIYKIKKVFLILFLIKKMRNIFTNYIDKYIISVITIIMVLYGIFATRLALGHEYYEIASPVKKAVSQQYYYNIDEDEDVDKTLDLTKIQKAYQRNDHEIYLNKKNTISQLLADNEVQESEKKKFEEKKTADKENKDLKNDVKDAGIDTQLAEKQQKQQKKSWIEDWLPDSDVKPFEVVGAYTSFKVWLSYPMATSISAKETRRISDNTTTTNLFTGTAKFSIMPSFFMAYGNDRFKFWRWEVELGYLPILASNNGEPQATSETTGYTFYPTKKDLSFHLLTLSLNNFVQHDFFHNKLVGFVGIGIGVGYAWSMSSRMSSDFVMPIITGHLGMSFMVGKKSKVNLGYTLMYSKFYMPNKYSFDRRNANGLDGSNRAIQSGSVSFEQFLIHSLSIEYQFYTG